MVLIPLFFSHTIFPNYQFPQPQRNGLIYLCFEKKNRGKLLRRKNGGRIGVAERKWGRREERESGHRHCSFDLIQRSLAAVAFINSSFFCFFPFFILFYFCIKFNFFRIFFGSILDF